MVRRLSGEEVGRGRRTGTSQVVSLPSRVEKKKRTKEEEEEREKAE